MADAVEAPIEAPVETPVEAVPAEAPVEAVPAQEEVAAAGDTALPETVEGAAADEPAAGGGDEVAEGEAPEETAVGGDETAPEQAAPAEPAPEDKKSQGGEGQDGGDEEKPVEVPSNLLGADGAILEDGAAESAAPVTEEVSAGKAPEDAAVAMAPEGDTAAEDVAAPVAQDVAAPAAQEGAAGEGVDAEAPTPDEDASSELEGAKVEGQDSSAAEKGGGKGKEEKGKGEKDDLEDDLPAVTEVRITSETKMASELKQIASYLGKNQPWKTRATALRRLRGMILGGAIHSLAFSKGLLAKDLSDTIPPLFSELRSQVPTYLDVIGWSTLRPTTP
jgi:hypothetical protein